MNPTIRLAPPRGHAPKSPAKNSPAPGNTTTIGGFEPLLRQAQRGEPRAVAALLEQHAPTIERICRRLAHDDGMHEDLMQNTYVAILAHLGQFRGDSAFSTWIYTLARTQRARAHRRRSLRPTGTETLLPATADDLESAVAGHEIGVALGTVLDSLPPLNRAIVWLRHVEGFSTREVAISLGLTDAAVKSRLRRSLMIARAMLVSLYEDVQGRTRPTWYGRCDA